MTTAMLETTLCWGQRDVGARQRHQYRHQHRCSLIKLIET